MQEAFRYIIYRILRETENGLQDVSDNSRITENKHILAYVSGFGFGIMAGAFSIVNILADTVRSWLAWLFSHGKCCVFVPFNRRQTFTTNTFALFHCRWGRPQSDCSAAIPASC